MTAPDPRLTLMRGGLAAAELEGRIAAARYVLPEPCVCAAFEAPLVASPQPGARQLDQLLHGEPFAVLAREGGFAFGQAGRDGYVGWVAQAALAPAAAAPTHRVTALRTWVFCAPDLKSAPLGLLSLNALPSAGEAQGRFLRGAGGWLFAGHLAPVGQGFAHDAAAVAALHLGAPYRWGGRDGVGMDCSGLVQQALYACGRACPRDSDQQRALLGREVAMGELRRGDQAFWPGHVAMMLDAERLIHANAHHMAVTVEPLQVAHARIAAAGGGEAGYRRP